MPWQPAEEDETNEEHGYIDCTADISNQGFRGEEETVSEHF